MELYVNKNQKKLRCGYTTGTCGAAAAMAAASKLLLHKEYKEVTLLTPKGITAFLSIDSTICEETSVTSSVIKDSGDDPDITNGITIYAKVYLGSTQLREDGPKVIITSGQGIGIVTKEGLEQQVGKPAINKIPRKMIRDAVEKVCNQSDYEGEIIVEISAPEGVELAKKTFNPKLGIEGGISILGTSGIVEPMSEKAFVDTIEIELKMMQAELVKNLLIVPGNYGQEYIKKHLNIQDAKAVKCSNYIGEAIDLAVSFSFESLLLVGNFGKLVKLAGGIMNTYSKIADGRFEIIGVHAALCGADKTTIEEIMECVTTEQALDILVANQLDTPVLESILGKINKVVCSRAGEKLKIGVILFSEKRGYLGMTEYAQELIQLQKIYH